MAASSLGARLPLGGCYAMRSASMADLSGYRQAYHDGQKITVKLRSPLTGNAADTRMNVNTRKMRRVEMVGQLIRPPSAGIAPLANLW